MIGVANDPAMNVVEEEGVLEAAGGRTIGWMLRGAADGTVIGWFHGQPGSRRDLRAFTDETLSRYGIRLLAIDRAGYGETSPAGLDRRHVACDLLTVAASTAPSTISSPTPTSNGRRPGWPTVSW
jgi:pimeloyl-ACP methyl ester carboxylesterase